MRPLELGLHAASLTCTVALGAGLYVVSHQRPAPLPPPPAAASLRNEGAERLEADVRRLQNDLDSLRLRLDETQGDRDALRTKVEDLQAVSARAPEAPPAPTPQSVAAALDDPKVKEKLREVVTEGFRERRNREQGPEAAKEREQRRLDRLSEELALNEAQKTQMGALLGETRAKLDGLRDAVRQKTLTREQAKEQLARTYAETDARAQAILTMEQFQKFQEVSADYRDRTMRMTSAPSRRDGGGNRGPREGPTP